MSTDRCKKCGSLVDAKAKKCHICGAAMSKTSGLVKALAVVFACVLLATCYSVMSGKATVSPSNSATPGPQASTKTITEAQDRYANHLKSGAEPIAKDALWMTGASLYVGVVDDKTNRNGYAEYICSDAASHGVKPQLVKVVDIVDVARDGKFRELGKALCK